MPHPTVAPQVYYAPLIILAEAISHLQPTNLLCRISDRETIRPNPDNGAPKIYWIFLPSATNLEGKLGQRFETSAGAKYDDGEADDMQVKMIIFPGEDGLDVVVWGKWTRGTMRHRHFDCRTSMIAMLEDLRLLDSEEGRKLESFAFLDHCPVYSAEIEEDVLAAHGFLSA